MAQNLVILSIVCVYTFSASFCTIEMSIIVIQKAVSN